MNNEFSNDKEQKTKCKECDLVFSNKLTRCPNTKMHSHQDYSNWKITGQRFYLLNANWNDDYSEAEMVISVEGIACVCEDCMKEGPGLKMTTNTPSFHGNNFSICLSCTKKAYKKDGGKVLTEKQWIALGRPGPDGDNYRHNEEKKND